MCTVTLVPNNKNFILTSNRDEAIGRETLPIDCYQINDTRMLFPKDQVAGGTWIAANHHGVTVCLLNHYQFEQLEAYKTWISRGEMVREFATTTDLTQAEQRFNALDLEDYRAFRMFIIVQNGDNLLCVWDGHSARVEVNVNTPKSSSSVDAKHVKSLRKNLFVDMKLVESKNTDDYLKYHTSHLPSRSKESVCMHRDDANTVSLSYVRVSGSSVSFRYADGSPCTAELGAESIMPLIRVVEGSLAAAEGSFAIAEDSFTTAEGSLRIVSTAVTK